MKAVILDYASLAPHDLDTKALFAMPFDWFTYNTTKPEETSERISDADIILTNKVVIDRELLSTNHKIKLIIILATGTNNVDLEAAKERSIPVCNVVNYSTESVAQHTFACLLHLQRRLGEYDKSVRDSSWTESPFFCLLDFTIEDLSDKTLGIIGYGAIGKRVKELAEAFRMNVLVSESMVPGRSKVGRVPLDTLLAESDVVSIHSPLSEYTENLINSEKLALMKDGAMLINMGRGGIVNEADLLEALTSGKLKAAAIDVLSVEPPEKENSIIKNQPDNLLVTPHIAWASKQARQNLVNQIVEILKSADRGSLINRVNS
ncbi:MAG: D-2-hydroxyacid dehydrogenase [Balneolaceae bacterium]|nr:MAG: D-2-hydroxyacid dehydrogenase [Balneolaceae bacterium]